MVDRISRDEGIPLNTIQSKALLGVGISFNFYLLILGDECLMKFAGCNLGLFVDQCRYNWGSSDLAGKATSLHELQWRVG